MSKLKIGDELEFLGHSMYNVEKGTRAIYEGTFTKWGVEFIQVKWIDVKDETQKGGGYLPEHFIKIKK